MNWCHETTKMGVPARHREPLRRGGRARPYPWSALGGFMEHSGYGTAFENSRIS